MKKLFIVFVLIAQIVAAQSKGTVKGTLTDGDSNNEPLPFANVFIKGTTIGGTSDFDGNYTLSVSAGNHVLVFSFIGYETVEKNIVIKEGETLVVNQQLSAKGGLTLDEVQIKATVSKDKETALLAEQKKATVIKESIGAQRLSQIGVSDAATATTKISGVTQSEGSGDIYIRGLGDRYLSTTMNGLPIPSDNVNNKNIDLSLFSTEVINNIGISKTYSTNSYADQASGNVDVASKRYSKKGFSIGVSGGGNTAALGVDNFRQTVVMNDVDFLGYHSKKYTIQDAITYQGWDPIAANTPLNLGFSISAAHKFKVFGKDLSLIGTASHSNSYEHREGTFTSYRANIPNKSYPDTENRGTRLNDSPDVEEFITNISTSAYVRGDLKLNSNHKVGYNALFINTGQDKLYEQGRNGLGYVFDQQPVEVGSFVRDQNYKQTILFVNQLMGEHKLSERNKLSWAGGYNYVFAEEPNRIRNEAIILDESNVTFADVSDFSQRKSKQRIKDTEYNAYIKNEYSLGEMDEDENRSFKLNTGLNYRFKERSFKSQFIGISTPGFTPGFPNSGFLVSNVDAISDIFTSQNFRSSANPRLSLKEQLPDAYTADLTVLAAFASLDFGLNKKLSGNFGIRFERDEFNVNWNVKNYQGPFGPRVGVLSREYSSVYPSVNLKYELNEKSFLRFASSLTQTLPEFKEFAPFQYEEPTGRVIQGNPELEKSEVFNADVKFEFFPKSGELLSATAFYKNIKDPINLSLTTGSSGYFEYNNTGGKAAVFGLEFEARRNLIENEDEQSLLSANANITLMSFKQDLLEKFKYFNIVETDLEGASEFIANGSLTYNNRKENPFMATVSGNYASDKIYALGSPESQVDRATLFNHAIVEKGFVTLDMVLTKQFNKNMSIKLTGKNLLNPVIKQVQRITRIDNNDVIVSDAVKTVESYTRGSLVTIGFTYKF